MGQFERTFFDYFQTMKRLLDVRPHSLGGFASSGAGSGGPPGGFRGYLPQSRVTYDKLETATLSGSTSLYDNLNHIRHDVGVINRAVAEHLFYREVVASGVTIIDLPDEAQLVSLVAHNGLVVDPLTYSLAANNFRINFQNTLNSGWVAVNYLGRPV